jgi:hypothetical protein
MKKKLLSAVMLGALGVVGCGDDHDHGGNQDTGPKYNTTDKVNTYLEGKTLTMTGSNIPSHPNGFDENVNFGQATQCYTSVTMRVSNGNYAVTSKMGTLLNASTVGSRGTCDRAAQSGELNFTSTVILVENVKADGSCFDFTATYNGFGQDGRGQISQDGKTLKLEIFFSGQATGHRCSDGAVGANTVRLNGAAFTGNAVQTYTIQ